jgi:hypothetical protein
MATTGAVLKPTEADRARWQELRRVYKAHNQNVSEWLSAVVEAKQTCLWMLTYATWAEFCEKELGKPIRGIQRLLQAGQDERQGGAPELTSEMEIEYRKVKRVGGQWLAAIKGTCKLFEGMSADNLHPDTKRECIDRMLHTLEVFEMWLADQGVTPDLSRHLSALKKAKRKKAGHG